MKYKEINEQLKLINKSSKEKIIAFIFALFLSFLIISAPAAILINLAIYRNFLKLIIFVGALFLSFAYFMIQNIYYVAISNGEIKGVWIVAFADSIIPTIIILGIILIIFEIGVI